MVRKVSRYYTIVGHREIPDDVWELLFRIARINAVNNMVMRSGSADGADMAGEVGALSVGGEIEAYIPWKHFNKVPDDSNHIVATNLPNFKQARELAKDIHPAWENCSKSSKLLHSRNIYQILGQDLMTPSEFVILYAKPEGNGVAGGTNTAYRLAKRFDIPCYNIYNEETFNELHREVSLWELEN